MSITSSNRLAALLVLTACSLSAQWKVGLNFRGTSGYVADGADETYVLGTDTTPTTRTTAKGNSITFYWSPVAWAAGVDRDAGIDVRLAGMNYKANNGYQPALVITGLTTGTYTVRVALGDAGSSQDYQYAQLQDGTTPLFTIDKTATAGLTFWDATGVIRTAAAWSGANASQTVTLTTTTARLVIGTPTALSGASTIAHLYLEKTGTTRRRGWVIE
jgi:hypothetical protein